MVRRLCILCFLLALSPGLALAQSAALMEAYNQFKALYEQGRYAEAEPFAAEALRLGEKELGSDHPHTGAFLNNLASLYQAQGRYAEAEPLVKRALALWEKALGREHPSAAKSGSLSQTVCRPGPLFRGRAALQALPGDLRDGAWARAPRRRRHA